ncbi:MAG: tRNA (adenosine(37)-N6)-threonylcarbamoyltransferase complex dimerization subunit type 1 TsaB [Clostridiales bacterium]|nr:tRNA (adenosine(37)-N6)-threonylcarbamoyltransferase complex dimerization subunit type 1 TsaB [Clostridiales bacterium]
MIVLVCDTSNSTCCAGLYGDGRELSYELGMEKKTHSEVFMPLLDRAMKKAGKDYSEIDAIAVTVGPGSFTGIRIGLSAVKGIAYAIQKPCISVSSTDALARSVTPVDGEKDLIIIPSFDARNKRVFASVKDAATMEELVKEGAYDSSELVSLLEKYKDRNIIVAGDGAPVMEEAMAGRFKAQFAPGAVITPKGIYEASKDKEAIGAEQLTASYCAVSSAQRLKK